MPSKKRQLVVKQPTPAAEVPDEDHQETRTKRVKRASQGKGKGKTVDEVKGASSDVEDSTTPSPKRKRTGKAGEKGDGVKKSRIRGMASFQSLPLGILVEMARYLDPLSLLELSRVKKAVHATLAHRNAVPLWRLARMNVDLPDLGATDLTEMQYAALMLDHTCSFCGETGKRADYSLRRRWCKDCQKAQLLKASAIEEKVGFTHEATFKRDVLAVNKQLWALQGSITSAQGRDERFAAFDAMKRYVEERIRNVKAAKEDAVVLAKWQKSSSESRRKAGEAARMARKKAIVERLVDLGYEERDCTAWHLSKISHLVDQPRVLTDLIFKRITPALVEHVERRKAARLEMQALARLKQLDRDLKLRYMALPKGDASTFPLFAQWVHLPQVQQFWKMEQPLPLDDASWTAAQPALDEDTDKARRAIKLDYARRIVAALQSAGASVSENVAAALAVPALPPSDLKKLALHDPNVPGSWSLSQRPLDLEHLAPSISDADLATLFAHPAALFTCTRYMCRPLLPYPDIHEHLVNEQSLGTATDAGGSAPSAVLSSSLVREIVRFMHVDLPKGEGEVGVAGGVHEKEPVQELQNRGAVFGCGLCSGTAWPSYVPAAESASELTWGEMLKHLTTYHFDLRTQELKTPISGKALIQLCKIENEGAKGDDDEMLAVASHEDKSEA